MRVVTCAVVLGLVAMVASAEISTTALTLVVQADGSATIVNGTGAAVNFDGYTISSAAGNLDVDGWYGIAEQYAYVLAQQAEMNFQPTIDFNNMWTGAGATMGAANPSVTALTEVTLGDGPVLAAGASGIMGSPVAAIVPGDLSFSYSVTGVGSTPGAVEVIPEPATMTLLGLGLVGFIARKRR